MAPLLFFYILLVYMMVNGIISETERIGDYDIQ